MSDRWTKVENDDHAQLVAVVERLDELIGYTRMLWENQADIVQYLESIESLKKEQMRKEYSDESCHCDRCEEKRSDGSRFDS